jgi:opacity protein-like surface antigen
LRGGLTLIRSAASNAQRARAREAARSLLRLSLDLFDVGKNFGCRCEPFAPHTILRKTLLTGKHIGIESDDVANLKENAAWAVGARIGYLITPNFLTYWDGGYTQTHFDQANYSELFPPYVSGVFALPGTTFDGWFLGSGFEYSFNWLVPGLFLKTEYRFSSYNSKTVTDLDVPVPTSFSETLHPYVQTVTTQLVYRFNWLGGH